jgi:predicted transposase/invertase (TIGR01784 family)
LKVGDQYGKIKKIYSINIVYFELGHGDDYIYHGITEFRGRRTKNILELTKTQKKLYKREKVGEIFPEYYLLRVEQFDEVATTPIDEWIYYLKTTEIPDSFTAQGLDEIREKQRVEDLSKEEREAYYRHLDQLNYEEGVIEHHRSEAKMEGKAEGKAEEKIEIARNAKDMGLSIDQIQKLTNLSTIEIENLI